MSVRSERLKKCTPLFILGGILLTTIFLCMMFFGIKYCVDARTKGRADTIYNVKWKSENPKIEFSVPSEEESSKTDYIFEGTLYADGEEVEILCRWRRPSRRLTIFFKDKYKKESTYEEDIALEGDYRRVRDNKVDITITTDNVYSGKYETITFYYESN